MLLQNTVINETKWIFLWQVWSDLRFRSAVRENGSHHVFRTLPENDVTQPRSKASELLSTRALANKNGSRAWFATETIVRSSTDPEENYQIGISCPGSLKVRSEE